MVISALVLFFLLTGALAIYLRAIDAPRPLWFISAGAYLARLGFVLVDNYLRIFAGTGDAPGYDAALRFVAEQWHNGVIFAPLTVSSGPGFDGTFVVLYTAILSPVYALFGADPFFARMAIAFFGTLIVANVYLIGTKLHNQRAGLCAAALAALFPYWIYLSGILYRDTLVIFLLTVLAYSVLRWQTETTNWAVLLVALVSALMALSMREVNIIAVAGMAAGVLYTRFDAGRKQILQLAGVGAVTLALAVILFGDTISVEGLARRRLWLSRELEGAYLSGYAYQSIPELLAFIPLGAFYFAFVPFPWQTPNVLAVIAIGQNLFIWYPVAILSIFGVRDALKQPQGKRLVLPLLAFGLAGIFGYGLVEGNIGPAMRHRSQFQFVFLVFAGVGIDRRIIKYLSNG